MLGPAPELPLWNVFSPKQRAGLFHKLSERCPISGAPGHSMRICPNGFLNLSGVLNPAQATAPDDSHWRGWQQ